MINLTPIVPSSNCRIVAAHCLLLVLLAIDCATAFGTDQEEYFPNWIRQAPQNRIDLDYDRNSNAEANGQRLFQICQTLKPGDRLVIQAGEYSVARLWNLDCSGQENLPIWIEAAEGAKVIVTRPDSKQNIVNVGVTQHVKFLRVRGIEFRGGSHGIRIYDCSNFCLDNCEVHRTADVAVSANSRNTEQLYLIANKIHDTSGTGEGMYLGGNDGSVIMHHSVIALNHIFNCGGMQGDGIEIKQGSWGNRIVANIVHDCNYPCITVYGTAGKARNIIERNLCYNSQNNVMQVQGEALVQNNVLINGANSAFATTDHQGKTINLTVVHNTMLNRTHAFRGNSWNDREGMILANNVIYSLEANAMHFPNGSKGAIIEGNVLRGGKVVDGNTQGRGLEDFLQASWDASKLDVRPAKDNKLFQNSSARYKTELDHAGKPRVTPILSGAWN